MPIGGRPDANAPELSHWMSDGFAHPSNLAVPPFANRDQHHAIHALIGGHPFARRRTAAMERTAAEQLHLRRHGPPSIKWNPAPQLFDRAVVRRSRHIRLVGPFHLMARVSQPRGQVAVVGEEQQPFTVVIQPADWIDVLTHTLEEIEDGLTPLRIRSGRDHARRFVQQDVSMALRRAETPAVDPDVVCSRIGLHPHLADRLAVDRNASLVDELLCGTPRSDAGLRQDFLKTNG